MTTASSPEFRPRSHPAAAPAPVSRPVDGSRVRTRLIDTSSALLDLLPTADDALAWVRDGDGLVGWGEAARFEPSGPDRFDEAARWWQDFVARADVRDDVRMPGTGPVAFVSMAFANTPGRSVIVVPQCVVGRRKGVTWVTEVGSERAPRLFPGMHPARPVRVPSTVRYSEGQLSVTAYREAVAEAVRRLRAGALRKVVLAHDLLATTPLSEGPVDARYLLHGLAGRNPNCWVFGVAGLVGATPELLLRRRGWGVSARVLAGTAWPHDGADDQTLARRLLSSAKNREEHRYAVESLAATLRPFCVGITLPSSPSVLRLRNVLHLATDVRATLAQDASLLTLADAAHPTAAVGGTPTDAAVGLIAELERMDRGRYAGPVGWVDSAGDGELGIALRCAQLEANTARLFAGCGIVADSDPDSEVAEANAKLIPMRDALENI